MKTLNLKFIDQATPMATNAQIMRTVTNDIIIPFFSAFNNLTYVRTIDTNAYVEVVFQINNSNYYLKIARTRANNGGDIRNSTSWDGIGSIHIGFSDDCENARHYLFQNNYPNNSPFSGDGGNWSWDSSMRTGFTTTRFITDNNNNLKMIYNFKQYWNNILSPLYPFIITKTVSNRDVIITLSNSSYNSYVSFLDDDNYGVHHLKSNNYLYNSENLIYKARIPIVLNSNNNSVVDVIDDDFVNIINTSLSSQYEYTNNGYCYARKLIAVGENQELYRQVAGEWWIKDPKGDEAPVTMESIYTGT